MSFARRSARGGRDQDDGVAELDEHRAAGLLRDPPGLDD